MRRAFRFIRPAALAAFVLLAGNLRSTAEDAAPPKGIAVGQIAPEFTLKDQNGRDVSLTDLRKKGPVAVVFIRSVEWCVYCQLQTIQLQRNLKEIEAGGGHIVVVTYDPPEKIKRFAEDRHITFPILSDPRSATIDAYAMRGRSPSRNQAGAARHGTFVVDENGIVRSMPYLTSFEERSVVDALVGAFKEAKTTKEGAKL